LITEIELKTFVPSLVASGILVYEAITGNTVSEHLSNELANGVLIGAGYMVTLYGIWKNHQKASSKVETTPPKIPPDQGANIIEETKPVATTPISTQEDYNQQISK
jgi:hypothetical protein